MKIEIGRDDPKFCDGCPMRDNTMNFCAKRCYWDYANLTDDDIGTTIRPQECIDRHDDKHSPPNKCYKCPACGNLELYVYSHEKHVTACMCPTCGCKQNIHEG